MSGKRVLVVDAGGRGNAIAHAFARSPVVSAVYVAPGNAGSEMLEKCRLASRHGKGPKSISELLDFVKKESIDLTFVGPEKPLSAGVVDLFERRGLAIVGPNRQASRLAAPDGPCSERL